MAEPIVIKWDEWLMSREKKRELLRKLGLSVPSRRKRAIGSQEKRLTAAFDGKRVPTLKHHQ